MKDKIDLGDFRFAKSMNKNFIFYTSLDDEDKLNFIDVAPYATAFNSTLDHMSEFKTSLNSRSAKPQAS